MNATSTSTAGNQYARCITVSERVRSDVDQKVISGDSFDRSRKYLLDGLSPVPGRASVSGEEKRLVTQILECICAKLFGLVERFINADVLRVSGDHGLGDQVALEALVRFSDEEFEHRELVGSRRRPHGGEHT